MINKHVISPLKSIRVLLRSRTEAFMIWLWVMVISLLISGNGFPPIRPALLSIISIIFVVASVYFYNDIQDEDMDSLNTVGITLNCNKSRVPFFSSCLVPRLCLLPMSYSSFHYFHPSDTILVHYYS